MKIVSLGEVLWDVIGKDEHLGGAPLNFAVHAARLGHEVLFVSAAGTDSRGDLVFAQIEKLGLSTRYVRRVKDHPTGTVTVALEAGGQPHFTIHRPAAYDFAEINNAELAELVSPRPDWIYFGTLFQTSSQNRDLTRKIVAASHGSRRFYDLNLRAGCYGPSLVAELMDSATVAKLNEEEMRTISPIFDLRAHSQEAFCREVAQRFALQAVCVTRGPGGCALLFANEYVEARGYEVSVADAVGAGDAFAAALLHGIENGWPGAEIADFANRVGALVASRAGAIPPWTLEEAGALAARTR